MFKGKAIIIVGPRQVGKTTLMNTITNNTNRIVFNCDNPTDRESLENKDLDYLKSLVDLHEIIVIDEAQKVSSIGQSIKLLVDYYGKKKQIIASGSSSINLLDNTHEPLTGRKYLFNLFPMSIPEVYNNKLLFFKRIEEHMIYGLYPEIVLQKTFKEKVEFLQEISSSYLYKDILEFQQIRNPHVLHKLLKALALQIGSEVSHNELSNLLGIDKKTVEKYVDLLEKSYVVFRLNPFASNKRRVISKKNKIFFYDLGIRNSIINNFNDLESRDDKGAIFENFCIIERMKQREYNKIYGNQYFYRTYDGAEVDLIEERDGQIFAYEFKTSKRDKKSEWKNYQIVHKKNLWEFLHE